MRISKRSQYGLRALFRLAESSGYSSVREVAEREGISPDYLEKILSDLEKGGLIKSKRGVAGGYALAKGPEEINLKDILEILESTMDLVECVGARCEREECCPTVSVWRKLDRTIKEKLESITLKDLMEDHE